MVGIFFSNERTFVGGGDAVTTTFLDSMGSGGATGGSGGATGGSGGATGGSGATSLVSSLMRR